MKNEIDVKIDKISDILSRIAVYVICFLSLVFLLWLSAQSFLGTAEINMDNSVSENIVFLEDNVALNILAFVVAVAVLWGLSFAAKKIPANALIVSAVAFTLIFGVWFVISSQSAPTFDSYYVCRGAYIASIGDWENIGNSYFYYYPFQFGYVFFCEIFIRLFRTGTDFMVMEFVNVGCLAISYLAAMNICRRVFRDDRVCKIAAIMYILCLPPIFFCTFTYGNIPGLMFTLLAFWMYFVFRDSGKFGFAVLSALFIGFAVAIKLNYLIAFVALAIVEVFAFLNKRNIKNVACLLLAVVCSLGIKNLILFSYEQRSGIDFGDGIPMLAWASMGLNEGYTCSGWYNYEFTAGLFEETGRDTAETSKLAAEEIKSRIEFFRENPEETARFFSDKFASVWNETTYQSIWTNEVRGRYDDPGKLATFVMESGKAKIVRYIDIYSQTLFVLASIGVAACIKERDTGFVLLPLTLLGGFLYHLIFEAKSQYALVYLAIMIPIAAYGFVFATGFAEEKIKCALKKRKEAKT